MEQWNLIHGENGKSTLVFSEKINDEFCFDIKSGEVTIYIDNEMTLTNKGVTVKDENGDDVGRSAINIEPNAKLNLYIAKDVTLTVDSGYGVEGETATSLGAKGGMGGFAGIRVPWIDENSNGLRDNGEQAELNLYGEGTVVALGGDAGNGGGAVTGNTGGRRRTDGAGARNRTVIGGIGGDANKHFGGSIVKNSYGFGESASCGGDGENCGIVMINDGVKIFAYGGAGGGSATAESGNENSGAGARRLSRGTESDGGRCWRSVGRRPLLLRGSDILLDMGSQIVSKVIMDWVLLILKPTLSLLEDIIPGGFRLRRGKNFMVGLGLDVVTLVGGQLVAQVVRLVRVVLLNIL